MAVEQLGVEFISQGFATLQNQIGAIDSKIDGLAGQAQKSSGILNSTISVALGNVLANAASAAFNALQSLGGAVINAGQQALTSYASYERLGSALESMIAREMVSTGASDDLATALGQAGPKAEELLGWIQQLAIESPFTQEGVANAFKTAMAYGFTTDEAQRLSKAMIDFSAGSGQTEASMNQIALALGQIQAKGKLSGQEVLQLVNAGLSVDKILADAFGKSTAEIVKMREDGLIPADQAIEAIVSSLEKDFGGAAKRQAGTFSGLISTLSDIKEVGLREFFAGTFQAIQPYIAEFADTLSSPEMMASIKQLGAQLGDFIKTLIQNLPSVVDMLKIAGSNLQMIGGAIASFASMAQGTLGPIIKSVFGKLSDWFTANAPLIAKWISKIGETLTLFGGFVITTWGIVKPIFEAIMNIILDLATFVMAVAVGDWQTAFDAMGKIVMDAWEGIKGLFANLADWVAGWFGTTWQATVDTWRGNFEMMGQIVGAVWEDVKKAFGDAGKVVGGYMTGLWNSVKGAWDNIVKVISGSLSTSQGNVNTTLKSISDGWTNIWNGINEFIAEILETISNFIRDTISALFEWMGLNEDEMYRKWADILEAMRLIATEIWNRIKEFVTTTLTNIADTVRTKINEAKTSLETAFTEMANIATTKATEIYTAITTKIAEIGTWITNNLETIKGWGKNVVQGISDGIASVAHKIGDAITDAIKAVSLVAGPIWETLKGFGSDILDGLSTGITTNWAKVATALTTAFESVKTNISNTASAIYKALVSVGSSIVDSLIKGIGDNIGKFVDYITGIIERAIRAMLNALGIPWPGSNLRADDDSKGIQSSMTDSIFTSLLAITEGIYQQAQSSTVLLAKIYDSVSGRQVQSSAGGGGSVTNNYYNSSRTNNLTAQSIIRPGGLALEFDTMSLVGR